MDSKGCITGSDEDRSLGSEFGTALEVSQDADDLCKITLSRIDIVRANHDDSKLGLKAEHERPDQLTDQFLVR